VRRIGITLSNHSDQKVPNDSPRVPDFSRGLHFDAGGALLPVTAQDVPTIALR
jgi:hypothetical protein